MFSTGFAILHPKDNNVLRDKLIYVFFMNLDIVMQQIVAAMPKGQYPSINRTDIENILIPVPPIDVQDKIIRECDIVDKEYASSRMTITSYRKKIAKIFDDLEIVKKSKMGGG